MNKKKFKHYDITEKIIKCAMTVHSSIGNGFQELIYQRALAVEFDYNGISYKREKEMPLYYRGKYIGSRRADFFIENHVMLELKAVSELLPVHMAQTINYLEAYQKQVGLLINFGGRSLTVKRAYNNKI